MEKQLEQYIRNLLKEGYNIHDIRNHLIQYGYSAQETDSTIYSIYHPAKHHLNTAIIAGAAVSIVFIVAISIILMSPGKETETLLDIELTALSQSILQPGDSFNFNTEITNMGSKNRYDVEVSYLLTSSSGEVITGKSKTIAVETSKSELTTIDIPYTAEPGRYTIEAIASYDDKEATSSLTLQVKAEEQQEEEQRECIAALCDDNDPTTKDYCDPEYNICVNERIEDESVEPEEQPEQQEEEPVQPSPPATTPLKQFKDVMKDILNTASRDPQKADEECRALSEQSFIDQCFFEIATTTQISGLCQGINSNDKRNQCYMEYALTSYDFSICSLITDKFLIDSCEALSSLAK